MLKIVLNRQFIRRKTYLDSTCIEKWTNARFKQQRLNCHKQFGLELLRRCLQYLGLQLLRKAALKELWAFGCSPNKDIKKQVQYK